MFKLNSIDDVDDVLSFIERFKSDISKYAELATSYDIKVDKNMFDSLESRLRQTKERHFYCINCGFTCRAISSYYVMKCIKCNGKLVLCSYLAPSERCDNCVKRFDCLTKNTTYKDFNFVKMTHTNVKIVITDYLPEDYEVLEVINE